MELFNTFGKSSGAITHVDWSEDSSIIRTNDNAYELLFYDIQGKRHLPGGASATKNENWATVNCTFSWGSMGIWKAS